VGYLLIYLTLAAALFGVFKDILSLRWRRRLVPFLVLVLIASSGAQAWLAWQEQRDAKYRSEVGKLHSRVYSLERFPVLQLCNSGLKYAGDPGKPLFDFGGEGLYLRMEDGEAKLSMIVRDAKGIVTAMVRDNSWFVPKSAGVLDRNFSDDALEIIGSRNEIVLQVQVVGEKVRFAGTTYRADGNGPFVFGPFISECDGVGKTLFRYPSAEFPGEMSKRAVQQGTEADRR